MKICILSPHPDDALLSCGILMQRRKAAGDEVFVLTVFSDNASRKKEDEEALSAIGAKVFYLDEKDAPDRNPRYQSIKEIVFGDYDDADRQCLARLSAALQKFCTENRIDTAYFPLAAGTHIDHRLCFDAGRFFSTCKKMFYEDRPYVFWPGILQARLGNHVPVVSPEEMSAAIKNSYFLEYFVPAGKTRDECLPLYLAALEKPMAVAEAKSKTLTAADAELKTLHAALSRYTSQMKYIYPDFETFMRDNINYGTTAFKKKAYCERFWEILY